MNHLRLIFEPILKYLPAPLRNRYGIVLLAFLVLMIFIDKNRLGTQIRLSSTVSNLDFEKEYFQSEIETINSQKQDLQEDVEKFARENYHMKRANEDVFIIEKNN